MKRGQAKKVQRRRNDWSIRMQYEFDFWQKNGSTPVFALLTYDEEHVHRTKLGNMSLCEADIRNFLKRLRKRLQKDDIFIRYFYAAEYGPTTQRPHYHILVFGIPDSWSLDRAFMVFQDSWIHGFVGNKFGRVKSKQGACQYATKYMLTAYLPLEDPEQVREFNRFSKGLGISFVHDVEIDEHGLHVGRDKVTDKRFRNSDYALALLDIYDYLFPFHQLYGRPEFPEIDIHCHEAIEIARTIQSYLRDRIRMQCKTKSYNFKLPRYLREKLFLPHERRLLLFADTVLYHEPRFREYLRKYYEYDNTHEVPMSVLMEMEEEKRLLSIFIKRRKDEKE